MTIARFLFSIHPQHGLHITAFNFCPAIPPPKCFIRDTVTYGNRPAGSGCPWCRGGSTRWSLNMNGWPVKEKRVQSQRHEAEEHLEHPYRRAASSSAPAPISSTKQGSSFLLICHHNEKPCSQKKGAGASCRKRKQTSSSSSQTHLENNQTQTWTVNLRPIGRGMSVHVCV